MGGDDLGFAGLMAAGIVGGLIKAALARGLENGVQFAVNKIAAQNAAAMSYNGPMGNFALGNVRPQTQAVANLLGPMFGITTIGGFRAGDQDHGLGLALDFMTGNDVAKGQRLADYVQAHSKELGLSYEIWRQRIFNVTRAAEGWRGMADRGSPTQNHMDHVHVSLLPTPGSAIAGLLSGGGGGAVSAGGWVRPADGPRTSPFGMRRNPVTGVTSLHDGSDIGAPSGSAVRAARSGTVSKVSSYNPAWAGLYTMINHGGGITTGYAHQSAQMVSPGQQVAGGARIGSVGSTGNSTGPHLHFQYIRDGVAINPGTIIPGLATGAEIVRSGLAMVHEKEIVLPRPLSDDLLSGGFGGNNYELSIEFSGPINSDVDVKKVVEKTINDIETRKGRKRS
jgi:hypothetical protein